MAEDAFANALAKRRQIYITVTGRRTGHPITILVWFVFGGNALWLLPVTGSKTQWYRNLRARLLKNAPAIRKVIQSFRKKYTPAEIKRWYTNLDVAVQIPFPIRHT